MSEKCMVCDRPAEKGRYYITTSLVSSTTKKTGLRFCKLHSDNLSKDIWTLVNQFLQGINIED